jgi:hypothetical protein
VKTINKSATKPTKHYRKKYFYAFFMIALTQLGGCANLGVQPWERDLLAKDEMALNSDPVELGLDDHIYFSKEATSGGRSFAGGGCGCN